jgi:hypothetical protein
VNTAVSAGDYSRCGTCGHIESRVECDVSCERASVDSSLYI